MAKKYQKIIKTLKQIADDLDNIGLNDSEAWYKQSTELSAVIQSVPKKKYKHVKELLELVLEGLHCMRQQTARDSLSLVDAIWEGLNAAEQSLSEESGPEQPLDEIQQNLAGQVQAVEASDVTATAVGNSDSSDPSIDSLDDAAAFLIQIEPDGQTDLVKLRESLQALINGDPDSKDCDDLISQAVETIDKLVDGRVQDPDQSLSEVGELLESAMHSMDSLSPPVDDTDVRKNDADPGTDSSVDDPDQDHMPQDADKELIGEFIAEGSDLISNAEEALLSLETDPEDMESVGMVFRAFHTVKGTSAFLELGLLSEFGHHAESLLSRVRDGEVRYSGGYADLSLRALDMIKELMAGVQAALAGQPLLKPQGYDELVKILANPEGAGISEEKDEAAAPAVDDVPAAEEQRVTEPGEDDSQQNSVEKQEVATVKSNPATTPDVGQSLRVQKPVNKGQQMVESSVRVSTQRLDRLIDMVGELVIAHSMVAQDYLVSNSDNHELAKKVAHTSKIVRELQDISMSMRMVPLKATFNKMARLVRDVSRKVGKNVNFVTEGEDTEIDRNLVNIINDPLVHMVRNAVDHGIESPEVRAENNKPEYGTVQLLAYHSAGSVVVEIRDDGQGLNRDVILTKAREKGLLGDPADINDRTFSDREVFNMIFEPGFSTAQVVTDVSGRGVGMDVVKKNIESLRGQVEIKSEYGNGSVFKMSLPLTLAIIDGMVVRVGAETYVIPTVSIIRSIKPDSNDLSTVLNQGEMVTLQGSLIPLYRMARFYHIDDAQQNAEEAVVVIVEDEERQAGLLVDELIGRQQVVIKSLGETMKDIPGISGGAIMPDGRVGLIIDVGGLVKLANDGHIVESQENIEGATDRTLAA